MLQIRLVCVLFEHPTALVSTILGIQAFVFLADNAAVFQELNELRALHFVCVHWLPERAVVLEKN